MEDCRQIGSEWLVSEEYVIPEEEDGVSQWVDMKMLGFISQVYLDGFKSECVNLLQKLEATKKNKMEVALY